MTFYRPHERVFAPNSGVLITKQSFKEECDINNILKKYLKTGLLTHVNTYNGRYEDLPDIHDYQEAILAIHEAQEAFASLPASVRRHYDNDPAAFMEAVHDPNRRDELRELGLLREARSLEPANDPAPDAPPASPEVEAKPAT